MFYCQLNEPYIYRIYQRFSSKGPILKLKCMLKMWPRKLTRNLTYMNNFMVRRGNGDFDMASGEVATSGTDEKHEIDHKEGEDTRVLPVHYSNNYFSLVPSEFMPIKITFKVPPGVTPRAILITGVTVVGDENLSAKSSHSLAEAMPKDARYCDNNLYGAIDIYLKILSNYSRSKIIERECLEPFEKPECEAFDIFVNEVLCVGKRCPYSCVKRALHSFSFASTGSARVCSQGHGEDYQVQLAVSQCPRSCIHYVTPSQ
ncbi:uncharacterized protein LOC126717045 isoform X2 [Quercus robur]|uniref:uncharacterized protein LOC126717045 isoform X2 n=1 Tax=Quercus robur TaxID=38942 RepID=UPI00216309E2|nr:uncharacterized protein LOC126717045 isoform X2 [Quercus robur]XP_050274159.1 uncharacterized protein LOC126717045 isoform X2 [Quercus robur]XP_050274160.1 uncharacterized protein LOC126717045 isoform X2 [Quercus robur]XP_050274161.1 uncharacterized protein LOC126717045 isoform X2 [Quercus robur]